MALDALILPCIEVDSIRIYEWRGRHSGAFRIMEETTMSAGNGEARQRHWGKTRNLTIIVLIIWAIFAFVLPWNAQSLNNMTFLGFPLGYYLCVQGSLAVFVLLIFFQNWRQDAIDDEFGVSDQ